MVARRSVSPRRVVSALVACSTGRVTGARSGSVMLPVRCCSMSTCVMREGTVVSPASRNTWYRWSLSGVRIIMEMMVLSWLVSHAPVIPL